MDQTDYKILSELQSEGRLSSQSLAERVGLSTTPCWRRVRKLEEEGVIAATVAILNPKRIGLEVTAVAEVSLAEHDEAAVREFEEIVALRPEILECHTMSGGHDYHLKVVCKNIGAYERLLQEHIIPCKAVKSVNSSFVLRSNKCTTALPLDV
jgi:Lrp/AsnC family transcriptional regulator